MNYFREDDLIPFDSYERDTTQDVLMPLSEYSRMRRLQEKDDWYSIHDEL